MVHNQGGESEASFEWKKKKKNKTTTRGDNSLISPLSLQVLSTWELLTGEGPVQRELAGLFLWRHHPSSSSTVTSQTPRKAPLGLILISFCHLAISPSLLGPGLEVGVTWFLQISEMFPSLLLSATRSSISPSSSLSGPDTFPATLWLQVVVLSCVQLFVTPCAIAYLAPRSMRFFRQESWHGLPFPPSGGFSPPRDRTHVPHTGVWIFLPLSPPGKLSNSKTCPQTKVCGPTLPPAWPLWCNQDYKDLDRLAWRLHSDQKGEIHQEERKGPVPRPWQSKTSTAHVEARRERESSAKAQRKMWFPRQEAGMSQQCGGRQSWTRGTCSLQQGKGRLAPLGLRLWFQEHTLSWEQLRGGGSVAQEYGRISSIHQPYSNAWEEPKSVRASVCST